MVFLTSLDILDTGFLTKTSRANQLGTGDRVNSGSALRLKGVEFNISSSSNLDENTSPGKYTEQSHPCISINPTEITLRIMLNNKNADTSNVWGINDMTLLSELIDLPRTLGIKALYYPVDNTATDTGSNSSRKRNNQMIYQLGSPDTSEDQGDLDLTIWTGTASANSKDLTDVNYIAVRFKSCEIIQTPNNNIMVTLNGVRTV